MRLAAAAELDAADLPVEEPTRAARERQFVTLLEANSGALARLAASYGRTASDRDDLLQDIALALWLALPRFRGESSERTFLFRIAHNRCVSHIARRRPIVSLDDVEHEPEDPGESPESGLQREQQSDGLLRAIRTLPMIYRQVIVLALEGMDYREIAQVLGIGESNVGVRLNRARQLLRKRLAVVT